MVGLSPLGKLWREKNGKFENLADNIHGRAGVQAPSEQGNAA
jgi:hypothetical protein